MSRELLYILLNGLSLVNLLGLQDPWVPNPDLPELFDGMYSRPAIICDAGSTGSRVFAFYVLHNGTNPEEIQIELMGRTDVGLSMYSIEGLFQNASESLLPLLQKGIARLGSDTPIYIFATGGVRSLKGEVKEKLWSSMELFLGQGLKAIHTGTLSLRTVDGTDEAMYGLLSSNYLLNEIEHSALNSPLETPVGVLDLGGSSLEISLVGPDGIAGTSDDILISFRSLGMLNFRGKISENDRGGVCRFETVCFYILSSYVSRETVLHAGK